MKRFKLLSFVLVLSFVAIGVLYTQSREQPPSWFLDHKEFYDKYGKNIVVGTGQATGNSASLTDKAAFAAAQAYVANQLESVIDNVFKMHLSEKGEDGDTSVSMSTDNYTKTTVKGMKLSYAKMLKRHVSSDGKTYYVAVMLDESRLLKEVETSFKKAIKNDEVFSDMDIDAAMIEVRSEIDRERSMHIDD